MIKSTTGVINIDDIRIPSNFENSLPKFSKLKKRYDFYKKTGEFDREILVDKNNILIDGYSTYLICKMLDIYKVRVLRITTDEDKRVKELQEKLAEFEKLRDNVYQELGYFDFD